METGSMSCWGGMQLCRYMCGGGLVAVYAHNILFIYGRANLISDTLHALYEQHFCLEILFFGSKEECLCLVV